MRDYLLLNVAEDGRVLSLKNIHMKCCGECMHFVKYENKCIKYSPHYIIDVFIDDDACDKWEEIKNG